MATRAEIEAVLREFPAALRGLVERERAAGNEVVEVGRYFPAPPAGAFVMLRRAATSDHEAGLEHVARMCSLYSGWWTDGGGRYFVVEPPPETPPGEPDMDAIRAAHASPVSPAAMRAPCAVPEAERFVLEIDHRGEMMTLRDGARSVSVVCTFWGEPVLYPRTLSGWWDASAKRSEPMSDAERREVLGTIVTLAARQGVTGMMTGD